MIKNLGTTPTMSSLVNFVIDVDSVFWISAKKVVMHFHRSYNSNLINELISRVVWIFDLKFEPCTLVDNDRVIETYIIHSPFPLIRLNLHKNLNFLLKVLFFSLFNILEKLGKLCFLTSLEVYFLLELMIVDSLSVHSKSLYPNLSLF